MNCSVCGESTQGQNIFNGSHRHLPDCIGRLKAKIAKLGECAWRPISEIHEDHGPCVVMDISAAGYREITHVCSLDFDESRWTHFAPIPSMTHEDAERLIAEMEAAKVNL